MKKMIYLIVAGMFFSCADNQLELVGDTLQPIEVLTTKAEMPDVSVENGYLVLKNLDALDALEASLAEMSDEAFLAWEKQVGFESALTFFMPYFDEFDALEKEGDMLKFQEEHKDVLRIINEDGMCDVDYPFDARGRASILSKEGKIKIGKTLWLYKADRKVTILDATEENVKKYADATLTNEGDGVFVDFYQAPLTKAGQADGYRTIWEECPRVDDKKCKTALDIFPEKVNGQSRMTLGLYQQAYKGNRTYKTRYSCRILELYTPSISFDLKNYETITSPRGRGGRYFYIATSEGATFPQFDIKFQYSWQGTSKVYEDKVSYSSTNTGKCFLRMFYGNS